MKPPNPSTAADDDSQMILNSNQSHSDADTGTIAMITATNFIDAVITASNEKPVIVDFVADWCGPCKQLTPILAEAVAKTGGRVSLVQIDIENPQNAPLIAQLRIQSIPMVYAFFGGQPVDGFNGAQPPSAVQAFVDKLTKMAGGTSTEDLLEAAEAALAAKDFATAGTTFQQILMTNPTEARAVAGTMRCLIGMGDLAQAKQMLGQLDDEMRADEAIAQVAAQIDMAEKAAESAAHLAQFEAEAQANPIDPAAHFALGTALYGAGQNAAAMQALTESIRLDRHWNEDAARLQLLDMFAAIGPTAPEVIAARRALSSLLFS